MLEIQIYFGVVLGACLMLLLANRAVKKDRQRRILIARGALVEGKRLVNVDGFDGVQFGGMLFSTNMFEYFAKSAREGEWFIFSKRLNGTVEITRVPCAVDESTSRQDVRIEESE